MRVRYVWPKLLLQLESEVDAAAQALARVRQSLDGARREAVQRAVGSTILEHSTLSTSSLPSASSFTVVGNTSGTAAASSTTHHRPPSASPHALAEPPSPNRPLSEPLHEKDENLGRHLQAASNSRSLPLKSSPQLQHHHQQQQQQQQQRAPRSSNPAAAAASRPRVGQSTKSSGPHGTRGELVIARAAASTATRAAAAASGKFRASPSLSSALAGGAPVVSSSSREQELSVQRRRRGSPGAKEEEEPERSGQAPSGPPSPDTELHHHHNTAGDSRQESSSGGSNGSSPEGSQGSLSLADEVRRLSAQLHVSALQAHAKY